MPLARREVVAHNYMTEATVVAFGRISDEPRQDVTAADNLAQGDKYGEAMQNFKLLFCTAIRS